jgi:hypothetical protein
LASTQRGYEKNPETVLRAVALNGYKQGAKGVHLFNYDYDGHRQSPVSPEEVAVVTQEWPRPNAFTKRNLQTLKDLADPKALERLDRCYYAETAGLWGPGDYRPQVPRKLALLGRGAGPFHAVHLTIEDDVAAGIKQGRIIKTELRLCLTDYEASMDRIRCFVNGQPVDLTAARKIQERAGRLADRAPAGRVWLSVVNPPVREGRNDILVVIEGLKTPEPWPTLHQCEVIVQCEAN